MRHLHTLAQPKVCQLYLKTTAAALGCIASSSSSSAAAVLRVEDRGAMYMPADDCAALALNVHGGRCTMASAYTACSQLRAAMLIGRALLTLAAAHVEQHILQLEVTVDHLAAAAAAVAAAVLKHKQQRQRHSTRSTSSSYWPNAASKFTCELYSTVPSPLLAGAWSWIGASMPQDTVSRQ
jgi:hypothetical protein